MKTKRKQRIKGMSEAELGKRWKKRKRLSKNKSEVCVRESRK